MKRGDWKERWKTKVVVRPSCIRRDGREVFVTGDLAGPGLVHLDDGHGQIIPHRASLPGGVAVDSPFVVTRNHLLVAMADRGILALDRRHQISNDWCHPTPKGRCNVAVFNGQAYISNWGDGSARGGLAVVDATQGAPVADDRLGGVGVVPTHALGRVYVGSADGFVRSADAPTLTSVWEQAQTGRISNQGTASADDTRLYLNNDKQTGTPAAVFALALETGEVAWSGKLDDIALTNVLLHGGSVYTATHKSLYKWDAATGHPLWKAQLAGGGPVWGSWLQVHHDLLYLHDRRKLRSFSSADGSEQTAISHPAREIGCYWIDGDDLFLGFVTKAPTGQPENLVTAYRWS